MARRAFIVGGTGQIGRAIAERLTECDWDVTVSSRGTRPVAHDRLARIGKVVRLDRDEPGALVRALAGGADAVIDTIAYSTTHADQLLEVESNVGTFVVISSASVYCDENGRTLDEAHVGGFPHFPEPIAESQQTVRPGPETYSTRKIALEQQLLDRARRPVTILRPCAVHGPHSVHPREWWFVKRMLDGRNVIPLAYLGQSRFHTSAARNIAELARTAIDRPGTRILNAADPAPPTVAEIGAAIGRHQNFHGRLLPMESDGAYPPAIGGTPWSIPALFTLDISASLALGYEPATTYEGAIGAVCDWLATTDRANWREVFPVLASYSRDLFDYAAEDRFFAQNDQRLA
jgi:nucleoside-diphosphate-sugar epimerase